MTREDELYEAASKFSDEFKYSESVDYMSIRVAFREGAKWADEHPINVWHGTNEEPRLKQWFLAQIGDNAFDTFVMEMYKNEDWKEWSNGINIKRWAYIRDLLPKGGEK